MNVIDMEDIRIESAVNNLNLFVDKMKEQSIIECGSLWGSDVWVIDKIKVKFTKVSEEHYHNEGMDSDFINFCKAYITHESPYDRKKLNILIPTLRCMEYVLTKTHHCGNVCLVDYNVLDGIITFICGKYSKDYAYKIGVELKNIVLFLLENKITYKFIGSWVNPIRMGKNSFLHKEKQDKKIPSEFTLNIFAEIFSQKLTDKRDIFTTSVVALLMSAPSRISEVLSLSVDCMITDRTKKGDQKWGLRFWAGKGFGGDIKWIPSVMEPITKLAIDRVIVITKDARAFAKLMELNFKSFCKRTNFDNYPDDKFLTTIQVCNILLNKIVSEKESVKLLKRLSLEYCDYKYTLKSLWDELQYHLPQGFPWYDKKKNIKFSDLLFLFFKDIFHPKKSDNIIKIYIPNKNTFHGGVCYQEKKDNIFKRHGYKNENGGDVYFHSHQIRHLLNTIAQRNGMSEYELAKWSGRASIKQNRVYNHVSEEEIIEKYESLKLTATNYTVSEKLTIRDPVSKESLLSISHSAIHKTEFGYCVHDYAISPCEKFRDCINCSEQICIKGNVDNLKRLKERLLDTNKLIGITMKNTSENDRQVDKDRWLTFHLKTKERLQELIGILESKDVSDGSFVRLSNKSYSHLSRTINEEKLLSHRNGGIYVKKIN